MSGCSFKKAFSTKNKAKCDAQKRKRVACWYKNALIFIAALRSICLQKNRTSLFVCCIALFDLSFQKNGTVFLQLSRYKFRFLHPVHEMLFFFQKYNPFETFYIGLFV